MMLESELTGGLIKWPQSKILGTLKILWLGFFLHDFTLQQWDCLPAVVRKVSSNRPGLFTCFCSVQVQLLPEPTQLILLSLLNKSVPSLPQKNPDKATVALPNGLQALSQLFQLAVQTDCNSAAEFCAVSCSGSGKTCWSQQGLDVVAHLLSEIVESAMDLEMVPTDCLLEDENYHLGSFTAGRGLIPVNYYLTVKLMITYYCY